MDKKVDKKDRSVAKRNISHTFSASIKGIRRLLSAIKALGFGVWLMVMSVTLILGVGVYIVCKLSFGLDLPFVSFTFTDNSDKLGQFGDFFGGVLNPLLSFMALLGVLYTIRTQGQELKEAREETRIANRIQDKQAAIFERQNFESVFFRLIDVHVRMAEKIREKAAPFGINGFDSTVTIVLERYGYLCEDADLERLTKPKPQYDLKEPPEEAEKKLLQEAYEEGVQGSIRVMLSQYYRNIYQILKLIDGFKVFAGDEDVGRRSARRIRFEYFQRRQYSNILRAQLSDDELKLLFFNCLSPYGAGLKVYVEQYSLLKHSHKAAFLGNKQYLSGLYEDAAYADYEEISLSTIMQFSRSRVNKHWRSMFSLASS